MNMRSGPEMTTDEKAEAFLDQDLSDLDFTQFCPADWERLPKTGSRRTSSRVAPKLECVK